MFSDWTDAESGTKTVMQAPAASVITQGCVANVC